MKTDVLDIQVPATLTKQMAAQFFKAFSIHTVDTLTRQWEETISVQRLSSSDMDTATFPGATSPSSSGTSPVCAAGVQTVRGRVSSRPRPGVLRGTATDIFLCICQQKPM